jgi:hypothetical protein
MQISPEIIGSVATLIGFATYIQYLYLLHHKRIKPHVFSWFVWGLISVIGWAAQWVDSAGPGAWPMAQTAIWCFVVAAISLKRGEKNITRSDWYVFIGSLLSLAAWAVTKDPAWAAVLITITDILAFYPTIRKSWHKPHEDAAFAFSISATKFAIALFAIENISVATFLYPFSLVFVNGGYVVMLLWRRRVLKMDKTKEPAEDFPGSL